MCCPRYFRSVPLIKIVRPWYTTKQSENKERSGNLFVLFIDAHLGKENNWWNCNLALHLMRWNKKESLKYLWIKFFKKNIWEGSLKAIKLYFSTIYLLYCTYKLSTFIKKICIAYLKFKGKPSLCLRRTNKYTCKHETR